MFISKLGSPERQENNSLTSKSRFKTPKIHELCYLMEFKNRAGSVLVSFKATSHLTIFDIPMRPVREDQDTDDVSHVKEDPQLP